MDATRVTITGNTYPVKDLLKRLGGTWNAAAKGWDVPAAKAEVARQIVANAGRSAAARGPKKCRCCGYVERRNARGYVDGDRILRSGECQSCYEERKMGY